jgi:hypothetical protein
VKHGQEIVDYNIIKCGTIVDKNELEPYEFIRCSNSYQKNSC